MVCRQLGQRGGISKGSARYGQGTGRIWMDELKCSGNEKRLADCPFAGWGREDCGHGEDAGVICAGGKKRQHLTTCIHIK